MTLSGYQEIQSTIDLLIQQNRAVIFTKTILPSTLKIQKAFEELGTDYEMVELDRRADGDAMEALLQTMTGAKTLPQVFVKGKCIGSVKETDVLKKNGRLAQLLNT